MQIMPRPPIPTWYVAVVVVRREDRFLVVQEPSHGNRWFFPAGRVEPGESLCDGARREVLEEAGIPVILEGILRIQHTPRRDGTARLRVIFLARPADDTPPKTTPDRESLQARWVTLAELDRLPLRGGGEVRDVFRAVTAGMPAAPLTLLAREDEPFVVPR
jgi:phosphatase NudJ